MATTEGQRLDETALRGSFIGRSHLWGLVEPVVDVISLSFIVLVLGGAAVIAVMRRRWLLAVQAAVLVGGANLTTQVLKYVVWDRPQLTEQVGAAANSLPSGHTTVAASAAAVGLLVAPRRWRPALAVAAAAYAGLTGVSTVIGGWHRPSDAVAAITVVLAWAGLTTVVTAYGRPEAVPRPDPARTSTMWISGLLLGAAVGAGTLALVALLRTRDMLADRDELEGLTNLGTAYAGGLLGVVAVTAAAFTAILIAHQAATRPAVAEPETVEAGSS